MINNCGTGFQPECFKRCLGPEARAALVLLLAAPALAGDAGAPRVSNFAPRGWHRGGTVEVRFNGVALVEPRGVLFLDTDKIKVVKTELGGTPSEDDRGRRGNANSSISATLEIA